MTGNMEQRLYRLEADDAAFKQQIAGILSQLAALAQQQYAGSGGYGGGGGGGPAYYGCTLTTDCAPGSPGVPAAGQSVWTLNSGARSTVNANATIYNDTPNDCPSGSQVILAQNSDGTFTIIGKVC